MDFDEWIDGLSPGAKRKALAIDREAQGCTKQHTRHPPPQAVESSKRGPSKMKVCLLLGLMVGGITLAIPFAVLGMLLCVTVIGVPAGLYCFYIGGLLGAAPIALLVEELNAHR